MNKIRIKPELLSLLVPLHSKSFSAPELCASYMKLPAFDDLTKSQVRQFILRNLKRLERAGLIAADKSQSRKTGSFQTTDRFRSGDYLKGSPHCKVKDIGTQPPKASPSNLNIQLSSHRLELTTTIAEVEEYEHLSQQNPEMQSSIQGLYNDARERCSKLLGKVKATETLIALVQSK